MLEPTCPTTPLVPCQCYLVALKMTLCLVHIGIHPHFPTSLIVLQISQGHVSSREVQTYHHTCKLGRDKQILRKQNMGLSSLPKMTDTSK